MTKEELGRVNYLSRQIDAEKSRLEQLRDYVGRITRELDGMPNQNTGYKKSAVEELTAQIIDTENRLAELCSQRAECRAGLVNAINAAVCDATQRAILIERYCFDNFFRSIAQKVHLSKSRVFAVHRQALKSLGITGRVEVDTASTLA